MDNNPSNFGTGGSPGRSGNVVTEQVQQGGQQVARQAQDAATQVAGQAQERARSVLQGQKDQVANNLNTVAQALRQTGQQLRDQDQGSVSQIPERAADQLERVSGYLQQREISQLVAELEDFARSNSTIFLTGAFALGAIAARFLKSSAQAGGAFRRGLSSSGMPQGSYNYGNVPYGRDTIGATPRVDMGYAPGLMGDAGVQPTGGAGVTSGGFHGGSESGHGGTIADFEKTDAIDTPGSSAIEPTGGLSRSWEVASGSDPRHDDGTAS